MFESDAHLHPSTTSGISFLALRAKKDPQGLIDALETTESEDYPMAITRFSGDTALTTRFGGVIVPFYNRLLRRDILDYVKAVQDGSYISPLDSSRPENHLLGYIASQSPVVLSMNQAQSLAIAIYLLYPTHAKPTEAQVLEFLKAYINENIGRLYSWSHGLFADVDNLALVYRFIPLPEPRD